MAGLTCPDAATEQTYIDNISFAADQFATASLELLIEPINPRDMPGYFMSQTDQALELMARIDHPTVRLQFDIYHHQISHIQIASVPARSEPDNGEVHYQAVFDHLDQLGYEGWLGCEYRPKGRTEDGLGWFQARTCPSSA